MKGARRVLIVDDHPLFRLGLAMALAGEGFEVAGEAEDGSSALSHPALKSVDAVLLDVKMPGIDGIEVCRNVRQLDAAPVVVMLTTYEEPGVIEAARKAGATAYLFKETAPKELSRLLAAILNDPQRDWMPRTSLPELTRREEEVLALLSLGMTNKAIARELSLSPDTVKDYLERVFAKLEVGDRLSAVRRATELGLVGR